MAAANIPKQQVYNSLDLAADVVLRKALASKFANDWLFRYNSDGIVVCQCKRCPPNNRAELSVANMSQLAARHKCKLEGAPSISRKRSPEPSFGPLPREDRGAAMPEGIQRAVRRRIGLFLVTQQLPFNILDNVHLQSVFQLLGVDVYKEKHYRTQLLDELYSEVKQATFKELRKLAKTVGKTSSLAGGRRSSTSLFYPYGGMLFLRVVDVSGKRKDAGAIKELHMEVLQDVCKDLGLASVECHGVIMDNTAANHSAMRMMQREMPTIVILGCSAHQMNLLCKDLSKPTKLEALQQEADHQAAASSARPVMEDHQNFSVAEVLGGVQSVALVISDSEAIRSELKAQQANHSAYSVRPNNPTRFAGLLLMAEDVEKLMPAIHGMVHGDNWPQLRLSSANAAVFEKCVLMVWNALVDHAKEWVEHAVIVSPRLALGVVAAFQRRAQTHYSPAYAAAYALDPANYKYLAPGTHPRPTMHRLQPTQQEDVVTVVARLAECSLGAARRELTLLTLGDWPTDMKSSVEAIVAETRTDEDGKTTTACISVRSGFWTFLGARCFPNLRLAAVRLLAMHVTTAAAERNWSSWGNTYNAGRSQLNVATAEKMVFIKANIPSSEPSEPSQLLAEGITI
ncbi:hypothetical protein QJQ45_009709 [Haematococcus lacustris]|nr:hypothetical protein QJQ45_009709 [Haematococcus lacustris]